MKLTRYITHEKPKNTRNHDIDTVRKLAAALKRFQLDEYRLNEQKHNEMIFWKRNDAGMLFEKTEMRGFHNVIVHNAVTTRRTK